MANPNIAAIAELNVGTLSWTLKSKQVIPFHSYGAYVTSNQNVTYDHHYDKDINGQTFGDMFMAGISVAGNATNSNSMYPNTVTAEGASTTWLAGNAVYDARHDGYQNMRVWYKALGASTNEGSGNNSIVATYSGTNNSNERAGCWDMIFANVNQSTPFATFPRNHGGGITYKSGGSYAYYDVGRAPTNHLYTNWQARQGMNILLMQDPIQGRAGDLIVCFTNSSRESDRWRGPYVMSIGGGAYNNTAIGSFGVTAVKGFDYGEFNPQHVLPFSTTRDYSEGSLAYRQMVVTHMQSSQTKDTLITVPSNLVLKINSIRAMNAQSGGMYASVDLDGLGSTINNSSAADAVGGSGADATVELARDVRIPVGARGVDLIDRPFYMVEGDMLKASVNSTIHDIYHFETEAKILVSFESMKD